MIKSMRLFLSTLALICCALFNLKAQTDVSTGFKGLRSLVVKGTDLYITDDSAGKIYKIAISTGNRTDSIQGLNSPSGLVIIGDDLYYSLGASNNGDVTKINLTSKASTPVVTGPGSTPDIAFKGNELYLTDAGGGKILKKDITTAGTASTEVITLGASRANKLLFKGNDLYFSHAIGSKVSKIDVTATPIMATEVVTGLGRPAGLLFIGNYLYIAESTAGKISRIDVTAGGTTATEVVSGLTRPFAMAIYRDSLYIAEQTKVSKIPLPCTPSKPVVTKTGTTLTTAVTGATYQWLNCATSNSPITGATNATYNPTANGSYALEVTKVNNCKDTSLCIAVTGVGLIENTFATALKLYPNPTSDNITIELGNNYTNVAVEITNVLGQVITSKSIPTVTNRKINLPINAPKGIYFVRIEAKEGFASFRVVKK